MSSSQRDAPLLSKVLICFQTFVELANFVFTEMVCDVAFSFLLTPYISQHLKTNTGKHFGVVFHSTRVAHKLLLYELGGPLYLLQRVCSCESYWVHHF